MAILAATGTPFCNTSYHASRETSGLPSGLGLLDLRSGIKETLGLFFDLRLQRSPVLHLLRIMSFENYESSEIELSAKASI